MLQLHLQHILLHTYPIYVLAKTKKQVINISVLLPLQFEYIGQIRTSKQDANGGCYFPPKK